MPARKGDRTRLQIKTAARVIFARDGFLNSTIAEIMKEAQRSIGVFYRYYKSKDELLLELTEEFRQKLLREIHLPLQPKQDPIENFEEKLGVFWHPAAIVGHRARPRHGRAPRVDPIQGPVG